ncbi:MAG: hypothetical protein KAR40_09640 [Candidatus Sabulitectum sp.]|nr:hypothetical protein [Candidatus Sabulitectum sp.]
MPNHFLEMTEIRSEEDERDGIPPVFIRVPVTGKADAIATKAKYTAEFVGRAHKDIHHICRHPDHENGCAAEVI